MEIKIKTTGAVVLTDELRQFVELKVGKATKLLDPTDTTALAEVEIGTTSAGQRTGDVFRAEINLSFEGGMVRAEAVRDTLHAAIDEAVGEARREVKKFRGKHRDLARRGAASVKNFFRRFGK